MRRSAEFYNHLTPSFVKLTLQRARDVLCMISLIIFEEIYVNYPLSCWGVNLIIHLRTYYYLYPGAWISYIRGLKDILKRILALRWTECTWCIRQGYASDVVRRYILQGMVLRCPSLIWFKFGWSIENWHVFQLLDFCLWGETFKLWYCMI